MSDHAVIATISPEGRALWDEWCAAADAKIAAARLAIAVPMFDGAQCLGEAHAELAGVEDAEFEKKAFVAGIGRRDDLDNVLAIGVVDGDLEICISKIGSLAPVASHDFDLSAFAKPEPSR